MNRLRTISVIGLGYIGLPTAVVLASRGVSVVGVDINSDVVARINRGEVHIVEPDLDAVTARVVQNGLLRATTSVSEADAFVIAVPTPFHDGKADMAYVKSAAASVAPVLKAGDLVVLESTSPPGTTEAMVVQLAALRPDLKFPGRQDGACDVRVAYCPERVLPGRVLVELVENDRVIGGITPECAARAEELYRIFCTGSLLRTDVRTAEMCKLTENSFRDVGIAFANELSVICEKLGVNVWELIRLANHHPRVNILQPGPGVGGHCIAVDPWFIVAAAPEQARLIRTAREVNDAKPAHVLANIKAAIAGARAAGIRPTVGVLGLAFKADVDDFRESPALQIAEAIASWSNCEVIVSEPHAEALPGRLSGLKHVRMSGDVHELIRESHIVVMLVNHRHYKEISREDLEGKAIIDTRGVWS
ncbi:UDP-N-acetyl-D-mannosamine dehydrogenase [Bradyrhizobium sp.]|uniref:UDP-N-acetyl-D-mannosamine dehydrogenase n=1 Tax=Bradyrhizobium sp. TaxID=376 RepID=UPI001DB373E1|nr:UDP-N-acetyl-D-mannosamine dehydrogenase [Bradyrhizobium sp.]MBI5321084.1 UDP-N-acetyl-D-mannosamine dehydrogenase [Bradyrhizobium sp.]